jgi:hypothetical protein
MSRAGSISQIRSRIASRLKSSAPRALRPFCAAIRSSCLPASQPNAPCASQPSRLQPYSTGVPLALCLVCLPPRERIVFSAFIRKVLKQEILSILSILSPLCLPLASQLPSLEPPACPYLLNCVSWGVLLESDSYCSVSTSGTDLKHDPI